MFEGGTWSSGLWPLSIHHLIHHLTMSRDIVGTYTCSQIHSNHHFTCTFLVLSEPARTLRTQPSHLRPIHRVKSLQLRKVPQARQDDLELTITHRLYPSLGLRLRVNIISIDLKQPSFQLEYTGTCEFIAGRQLETCREISTTRQVCDSDSAFKLQESRLSSVEL